MTLSRRFALLLCFAFWQGGFMFYGGVVVPVGSHILGSESDQGFITQAVTNYLNVAGAACLILWGATLWFDNRSQSWQRWPSWVLFSCIVLGLITLARIHTLMDRLLDAPSHVIADETAFRRLHRVYLATCTAQWLASLLLLGLTLRLWQCADGGGSRIDYHS